MVSDLREIANGLSFPEGPVALSDGTVLFVEIGAGRIGRVLPDGRKETVATPKGAPNSIAFGPDGALYICNNGGGFSFGEIEGMFQPNGEGLDYSGGGIDRLDLETGTIRPLYRTVGGHPLLMPNDLVFDRDGGFYFTDHGFRHDRSLEYGGVYYARSDGSDIREIAFPLLTANGVALSPDESTLYVSETETGRIRGYEIIEPGVVKLPPHHRPGDAVFAQLEGFRRYDSMAVEENGNLCVASLTPGGVTVISPSGRLVEVVPVPDEFCTNICFGGADMRTAFMTLSGTGRIVSTRWPRPGLKLNFSR
ncbi:MAG: SMP-30/gluconolactonase/LRE family protein [Rhodospirillales bacterium]|nr:SMP-30/gluconolactonase/LRE family protein [Rhodospirillales bacterium]